MSSISSEANISQSRDWLESLAGPIEPLSESIESVPLDDTCEPSTKTALSHINELMTAGALRNVQFTEPVIGPPIFICSIFATYQNEIYEATGSSIRRREAKQIASKNLLELLNMSTADVVKDAQTYAGKNDTSPSPTSFSNINAIAQLQEYAMKKFEPLPRYEELVLSNDPGFTVRCEFRSHVVQGKALSKKNAKHLAAQQMWARVNNMTIEGIEMTSVAKCNQRSIISDASKNCLSDIYNCLTSALAVSSDTSTSTASDPKRNWITTLQEYVHTKPGKNLPVYRDLQSNGPTHRPNFTVLCEWDTLSVNGEGLQKKVAKQAAAEKMCKMLGL